MRDDLSPRLGGQQSDLTGREPRLGGDRRTQATLRITIDVTGVREALARIPQVAEAGVYLLQAAASLPIGMWTAIAQAEDNHNQIIALAELASAFQTDTYAVMAVTGCSKEEAREMLRAGANEFGHISYEDARRHIKYGIYRRYLTARVEEESDAQEAEG